MFDIVQIMDKMGNISQRENDGIHIITIIVKFYNYFINDTKYLANT